MKKTIGIVAVCALVVLAGCTLPWMSEDADNNTENNSNQEVEHALLGVFDEETNTYKGVRVSSNGKQQNVSFEGYRPFESEVAVPGVSFFEKDSVIYMYDFDADEMKETSLPKLKDVNRDDFELWLAHNSQVTDQNKTLLFIGYTDTTTEEYIGNKTAGLGLYYPDEIDEFLYDFKVDTFEKTNFRQEIKDVVERKGVWGGFVYPNIIDQNSGTIIASFNGEGVGSAAFRYNLNTKEVNIENSQDANGWLIESRSPENYAVNLGDVVEIRNIETDEVQDTVTEIFSRNLFFSEKLNTIFSKTESTMVATDVKINEVKELTSLDENSYNKYVFFENAGNGFYADMFAEDLSAIEFGLDTK